MYQGDQYSLFGELACEPSDWSELRQWPSTVMLRAMLRLADWAAAEPRRWRCSRLNWLYQELSYREIAGVAGVPATVIGRLCATCDLTDYDEYTPSELDGESPAWHRRLGAKRPYPGDSPTWRRVETLCDFAANFPEKWRVIRLAYVEPPLAQTEIAKLTQTPQRTVSSWLPPPKLDPDAAANIINL